MLHQETQHIHFHPGHKIKRKAVNGAIQTGSKESTVDHGEYWEKRREREL